jgi:hypothetical protein
MLSFSRICPLSQTTVRFRRIFPRPKLPGFLAIDLATKKNNKDDADLLRLISVELVFFLGLISMGTAVLYPG